MGFPSIYDTFGKIVYKDKTYSLKNAPLGRKEQKCISLFVKIGCIYAIKPGGVCRYWKYLIKDKRLYITSIPCGYVCKPKKPKIIQKCEVEFGEYLPRVRVEPRKNKDILYDIFKKKNRVFMSWYSGELKIIKKITTVDRLVKIELLILKIKNGKVVAKYKRKIFGHAGRKLKGYIEA